MWWLLACADDVKLPPAETGGGADDTAAPDTAAHDSGESGGPGETATTDDTGAADSADSADTASTDPTPCAAWGDPVQTGAVADEALEEVSDVVPSLANPGVLWVLEDHGNEAAIYALDPTGATVGTLWVDGVENEDWEDLDLVPCDGGDCLLVGDLGDNLGQRTDAAVLRVAEPLLDGLTETWTETPERFGVRWPEVPRNVEALAHTGDGRVLLVTKRMDRTAEVYVLPTLADGVVPELLGIITTAEPEQNEGDGMVTSASTWPDGTRVLLRTYGLTYELSLDAAPTDVSGATLAVLPSPMVAHDESVAYDTVLRGYWTIPEAIAAPIWFVPCVD